MYIVTTEVTAKKANTSVKGGLTRAIRKGICTKQKECEDIFRVVSLYKVWGLKTACEDGTRVWPVKIACEDGTRAWPAKTACEDGIRVWPAKMAREDGIKPAHETAFSSDGVVLRSLGGASQALRLG